MDAATRRVENLRAAPQIGDYALIGDCRTALLLSRDGSIDWLCLPHFSSPSVFGRILDASAGHFSVTPYGRFRATRSYLENTPVVQTTFETSTGAIRVLDTLTVLDGLSPMRPMRELLRVIEGVSGEVEIAIEICPQPDFGRATFRLSELSGVGWSFTWRDSVMSVRSDVPLVRDGASLRAVVRCGKGSRYRVSLSYENGDPALFPPLGGDADQRLQKTIDWWRRWTEQCTYRGPYRDAVLRSALTLKQLTYSLSGALIAAPTTSLPEIIGGDRNWDYRFCWLRDAGLTVQALVGIGFKEDACAYLDWLLHATRLTWPELRVAYDVYGRDTLQEEELPLEGYCGSRPVRIGNKAHAQLQLDVYGDVILAAETVATAGGKLDRTKARMLRGLGKTVCRDWRKPDSGMWEIRGPRRQFTFSKLMCWVALDRLLALHKRGCIALGSLEEQFRHERDEIVSAIESRGYNAQLGSYTSELDGAHVVANLLLMARLGYVRPDNPRFAGTYDLVIKRLGRNGLLYRYEPGYTGVKLREATFGICTFWAVEVLAARGEVTAAEKMFERAWSCANDLGLFGEEIDPENFAVVGNFPQAFTHVGLINAALAIERAKAGAASC